MKDDQTLLGEYASGSEAAFQELVTRYANLVYSAAVRLVGGDAHLAEDVSQTVFIDLARMAKGLPQDRRLGGWLHRHTCFVAAKAVRGERRRQMREAQAAQMNPPQDHSEANLAEIAFVLDKAINRLSAVDRNAILLRFFEGLDFRSVGQALGMNEAAAQKRVARALDRLEVKLLRQGTACSAGVLGTVLGTNAVTAAPPGLAANLANTALAHASQNASAISLLKLMTITKSKVCVAAALVLASGVTCLLLEHQASARSGDLDQSLRRQARQIAQLAEDNQSLSNLAAQAKGSAESELIELQGLRREGEILHQQADALAKVQEKTRRAAPSERNKSQTMLQVGEMVWAKQESAQGWIRAFIGYAKAHNGQMPSSLEQARPYWPKDFSQRTGEAPDQYDLVYHGSLDSLTNLDVIVFREKNPWPYGNQAYGTGKFGRFYALANGQVQYCSSSDKTAVGNYDAYESAHLASQSSHE
jgi:RNA polymerase sigma factor (sigma-70 family)